MCVCECECVCAVYIVVNAPPPPPPPFPRLPLCAYPVTLGRDQCTIFVHVKIENAADAMYEASPKFTDYSEIN